MAWNCVNCESANDYQNNYCEVCGIERYFSVEEVNSMLAQKEASPDDLKKAKANSKRSNTINKKLREEKKELESQVDELQTFYDNHEYEFQKKEDQVEYLRKENFRLKIGLLFAIILILFFFFVKVNIEILF